MEGDTIDASALAEPDVIVAGDAEASEGGADELAEMRPAIQTEVTEKPAPEVVTMTPAPNAGPATQIADLSADEASLTKADELSPMQDVPATPATVAAPKPAADGEASLIPADKLAVEPKIQTAPAKADAASTGAGSERSAPSNTPAADAEYQQTAQVGADTDAPELVDKAVSQTVARERAQSDAEVLAPLREARPATERMPGELLRGEIRDARGAASVADVKPDTKASVADVKAPASPTTTQTAQPSAATLATQPPSGQNTPAFELLLAQMDGAMSADPGLTDAPMDPATAKSDSAFDPAAARLEARSEIRTASTLQFAQGPRLTPQSAQTMAAQIAQRFNEGSRIFDIRMDPPELGRVEVRLEVGSDNSVRALLAAERSETLAELQRSARELERALAEAGLELGEDALSFSLTDDGAAAEDFGDDSAPDQPVFADGDGDFEALSSPLAPLSTYGFLLARADGLDVSV
jgi:flagellar hook-length control protein FliK